MGLGPSLLNLHNFAPSSCLGMRNYCFSVDMVEIEVYRARIGQFCHGRIAKSKKGGGGGGLYSGEYDPFSKNRCRGNGFCIRDGLVLDPDGSVRCFKTLEFRADDGPDRVLSFLVYIYYSLFIWFTLSSILISTCYDYSHQLGVSPSYTHNLPWYGIPGVALIHILGLHFLYFWHIV